MIQTKYFLPIEKTDIFFSNLCFDNPRSESEIKIIAHELRQANETNGGIPPSARYCGKEFLNLKDQTMAFLNARKRDPTVTQFIAQNKGEKDAYILLSKMCVIVRVELNTQQEGTKVSKEYFEKLDNAYKVVNFLRYMTVTEDEYPCSMLLDYYRLRNSDEIKTTIIDFLLMSNEKIYLKEKELQTRFRSFNSVLYEYNKIIKLAEGKHREPKFKYLCSTISSMMTASSADNTRVLIEQVSILEMLLAHPPDESKFHIENSISRQFRKKILLLTHEAGNLCDEKLLKLIYEARSNVAHGNYVSLEKTTKSLTAFYKEQGKTVKLENVLDYLIGDLHKILRIVIREFLRDETKLLLLKEI